MIQGLDYSWARPGGAAIAAAGKSFVVRYVPYPGDGGKGLTADELADLRANGLALGLVFESTEGRMLEGREAGEYDARTAIVALGSLGFPPSVPAFFACDFDAQPAQYAALDEYLTGAASVLGPERVGVYGSFEVIEHCQSAGTATWLWSTYAWSGGRRSPFAHIHQYRNGQELNGGAVDYCEARSLDGWAWLPPGQEDDMTLAEDTAMALLATPAQVATLPDARADVLASVLERLRQVLTTGDQYPDGGIAFDVWALQSAVDALKAEVASLKEHRCS